MNKKSRKTLAIIFGSGLLVILGLIFLLNRSGGGEEYMTPSGIIAETVPTVFPDYSVPRVGLREAKRVFDEDGAIFVDVRSASSFEQTHIPGAVSAPLNLNNYFIDAPQDAIIFTYCTWPSEASSARAALLLMDQGYESVFALLGGLEAWIDAGYPVE